MVHPVFRIGKTEAGSQTKFLNRRYCVSRFNNFPNSACYFIGNTRIFQRDFNSTACATTFIITKILLRLIHSLNYRCNNLANRALQLAVVSDG